MNWESVTSIAKKVQVGELKAVELAKKALDLIAKNKEYNAVLRTNPEALKIAEEIDNRVEQGEDIGKLAGVPYLAKDNFLTKGLETTAASNILKGYIPPYSSTAIDNLNKEGAVLIGKTNLDAFAHGSSTENSDYGPTLNPHDKSRVPGGSSGGSAAAIALGLVPFALGTDTGGSIRQPASLCGVVGYKPTYGIVSRYGVVAMASSTDVIGPLTNTVEDSALILDVMAGKDQRDSTMINSSGGYTDSKAGLKGLKAGVVKQFFEDGIQPEVAEAVKSRIDAMEKAGAEIVEIDLPTSKSALAVYYVVVSAEVSSNLSRYDGMRYGPRHESSDLGETYKKSRSDGFNSENRRRIMIGTYVLSSGYYDAYYKKAQQVRTLIKDDFSKALDGVDVLVGATAPTTAFKIGEKDKDPVAMYMSDVLTVAPSLIGLPAISIPIGVDSSKLPIGFQLIAGQDRDGDLLAIAKEVEKL